MTPLPREGNFEGAANEAQWAAAARWASRYRRQHRNENRWERFARAEIEDEHYRDWGR